MTKIDALQIWWTGPIAYRGQTTYANTIKGIARRQIRPHWLRG